MTDKEKLEDAIHALAVLQEAAGEYGIMTAGLMPLESMKTDYFKREHKRLSKAITEAATVLRLEWDSVLPERAEP